MNGRVVRMRDERKEKRVGAEIGWMELSFCLNGCTNRELMVRADVSCTIFSKSNKWIGRTSKKTARLTWTHMYSQTPSSNFRDKRRQHPFSLDTRRHGHQSFGRRSSSCRGKEGADWVQNTNKLVYCVSSYPTNGSIKKDWILDYTFHGVVGDTSPSLSSASPNDYRNNNEKMCGWKLCSPKRYDEREVRKRSERTIGLWSSFCSWEMMARYSLPRLYTHAPRSSFNDSFQDLIGI